MTPLKTSVWAGAAFILGWAAHEGLARLPGHYESTAPTAFQQEQALKSEEERKKAAKGGDVITPLSTRDPAALVMGVDEGSTCADLQRLQPCDCAAERLRKTGRAKPESF